MAVGLVLATMIAARLRERTCRNTRLDNPHSKQQSNLQENNRGPDFPEEQLRFASAGKIIQSPRLDRGLLNEKVTKDAIFGEGQPANKHR